MQISKLGVNKQVEKKVFKSFFQVLADIKDPQAMERFFSDILSPTERAVLAKRLAIAHYLRKNKSYDVIKNDLKVSSATIATIQGWLEQDNEGLNIALKAIEADEWAGELADKISQSVKSWFKTPSR
ncbi:MAG: hypothetical protein UY17_C0033G0007 [Candidatus Beckwithbacteria bacterium GW2011_GWC2_47_9]|uniref:TrpR like protein, YerC/YecD n=1 Tax=Candidatus Beckwithbacteria bacterium GW2011_GWC2_47_9 TaxID=1618373 RepID=A0A0G1TYY4_9BACT|nr:MAG: hypothetical protein UY17_C0033G0007 [Candidatus Beckwithbacteria bacterium GW2011_GWC2_47_9]